MKTKTIHQISGWRRLVLWPLSLLLRLWYSTISMNVSPEDMEIITRKDAPTIIITWHNRIFLVASVSRRFRKHRPVSHLISASRDGAWLAAFFSLMGLVVVRGSSSQRTFGATRELLKALEAGNDIGLTPDGPKGPIYDFKKGAVRVARQSGAPILLVSGRMRRAWRLNSWDRFYLPLPFSSVEMKLRYFSNYEALGVDSVEEATELLRKELMEISPDPEA